MDSADSIAAGLPVDKWYNLPDSAFIRSGKPFFIPEFDSSFVAYPGLAVRIDRLGKGIAAKYASRYYACVAPSVSVVTGDSNNEACNGIFTGRDTVFDGSFWFGNFIDVEALEGKEIVFSFGNGDKDIKICANRMIENAPRIIEPLSRRFTIKMGDMITLGTLGSPIELETGMRVKARCDDEELLNIPIK